MKRTLSTAALTTVVTLSSALPVFAQSSIGLQPPANTAIDPTVSNIGLNNVVRFVINGLVILGIIAALAFLIYGGIKWITSGGDKGGVESARNHIIAAIIGLVIILLAWVILNIVFSLVGAGSLTQTLTIPSLTNP